MRGMRPAATRRLQPEPGWSALQASQASDFFPELPCEFSAVRARYLGSGKPDQSLAILQISWFAGLEEQKLLSHLVMVRCWPLHCQFGQDSCSFRPEFIVKTTFARRRVAGDNSDITLQPVKLSVQEYGR